MSILRVPDCVVPWSDERLRTSTDAAHELGRRVTDLDDVPSIEGPTGTRRYTSTDLYRAKHGVSPNVWTSGTWVEGPDGLEFQPDPQRELTGRDRRRLAVACLGGASVLAALIAWWIR